MGAGASTATQALRQPGSANLEKIAQAVEGFDLAKLDNAERATMREDLRSPSVLDVGATPHIACHVPDLDLAALDDAERATARDALGKIEVPDDNGAESTNSSRSQAKCVDGSDVTSDYPTNFEIFQGDEKVGTIVRLLGSGSYGTVYLFDLADRAGQDSRGAQQCAAKAVKAQLDAQKRASLEKAMAVECSIGFAMGRSAHAASVVRMIVPDLPDLSTNARGALLLCDYCDSGDLSEAMGKDYNGELYSEKGARVWPLASARTHPSR